MSAAVVVDMALYGSLTFDSRKAWDEWVAAAGVPIARCFKVEVSGASLTAHLYAVDEKGHFYRDAKDRWSAAVDEPMVVSVPMAPMPALMVRELGGSHQVSGVAS